MIFDLIDLLLWLYALLILITIIGWDSSNSSSTVRNEFLVSIIVPFRNEEKHLKSTIQSILDNDYQNFELVLIDDHSEDNSLSICKEFETKYDNIKVITLHEEKGKKAAVNKGVNHAIGDVILQTDADCRVGSSWVTSMTNELDTDTQLLLGPVKVSAENSKWNWFNQIEFGFLQAFTAASAHFNRPLMANGANLMYRKQAYLAYVKSGLGAEYASGDDQFLLQYVKSQFNNGVKYVKNKEAITETVFPAEWTAMIQQRARWMKKKNTPNTIDLSIGIILFSAQFLAPITLLLSLFNQEFIQLFWTILFVKTGAEMILGYLFMSFFGIKHLRQIPIYALTYPVFLVSIILLAKQTSNTWKGREI